MAAGAAALQGGEALQGGSGEGQAGGRPPPPRTPPTPAVMVPKEDPHSTKNQAAMAAGQVPGALLHGSSGLPGPPPLQPAAGWHAKAAAAAMAQTARTAETPSAASVILTRAGRSASGV